MSVKEMVKNIESKIMKTDEENNNAIDELKVIELIRKHRRSGKSYAKVAEYLNQQGFLSKQGKQWSAKVVMDVVKRDKAG